MTADPMAGQAFVQITLGQVYSEVTGMRGEVQNITSNIQIALDRGNDHETRIRTLERRVWMAFGMALVLGPASSAGIALWAIYAH